MSKAWVTFSVFLYTYSFRAELRENYFFLLRLAQGFMFSIKFVSSEARCVKWVSTQRTQSTLPMPDIFIIKLERRKWWSKHFVLFFILFQLGWGLMIVINCMGFACIVTLTRKNVVLKDHSLNKLLMLYITVSGLTTYSIPDHQSLNWPFEAVVGFHVYWDDQPVETQISWFLYSKMYCHWV